MQDLSFGQFVSIESMLSSPSPQESKMLHLACVLIRPKSETIYSNDNEKLEAEHREAILREPFYNIAFTLNNLLSDREEFHRVMFKDVFYEYGDSEVVTEDEDEPKESVQEYSFERKWYWYSMIDRLAQEDVRRHSELMDLPLMVVAPKWSYEVSKDKMERERSNRQQAEMSARARSRR